MLKTKWILFLGLAHLAAADTGWYNQKLEGWYYFQEQSAENEELRGLAPEEAHDILEEEKQKLQAVLSLAVVEPTKENIENYLSLSNRLTGQSARFAEKWGDVLEETSLEKFSATRFLLFCFKGQDPASSEAASIAKTFAQKYGWTLKALSLDGKGADGIEKFETDAGLVQKLKIESTPSFYAVDPFTDNVAPVGAGTISLAELEHNIQLHCGHEDE